ncbi:MAG: glutamate racemase [Abitibacteriaceae bacterium]|nr:glutamate racemase [Abditibacteriaceae bacterium]
MSAVTSLIPAQSAPIIGIRDSGVGGLTVARRVRQALPNATLLYFADTAHVPYGDRPPHEVRHFALSISQFLIDQGAQIIVFACNTSSAYALDQARHRFNNPIVGMIEPGARAAVAASSGGTIGVLATQATVDSQVYTRSLARLKPGTPCLEIGCPEFVPLVESEQTHSQAAYRASQHYLQPLLEAKADTIILGCTHYPLLLPLLREVAPHVCFVDPAEAVAAEVGALVDQLNPLACPKAAAAPDALRDIIYVSGPRDGVQHWSQKLFQELAPQRSLEMRSGPVFDVS